MVMLDAAAPVRHEPARERLLGHPRAVGRTAETKGEPVPVRAFGRCEFSFLRARPA
jgi:hypothetical protein